MARTMSTTWTTVSPDFSVYHTAGKALSDGANPYTDPSLYTGVGYPPNSILTFIPFSWMPLIVSQRIFTILSVIAIYACILLTYKIAGVRVTQAGLVVTFCLAFISFPTRFTLGMGQNNVLALVFLIGAIYAFTHRSSAWAGVLLGVAITMKPLFGFFVIPFLLLRAWHTLAVAGTAAAAIAGVTALLYDTELFRFYLTDVVPPLVGTTGREVYYNQGLLGFISRLTDTPGARQLWYYIATAALIAGGMRISRRDRVAHVFAVFLTVLVLIDSLAWQHHFVWLIPSFIVAGIHTWKTQSRRDLITIAVAYLLVSINIADPTIITGPLTPYVLSHGFFGALLLLMVLISQTYTLPRVVTHPVSQTPNRINR